MTILVTGGLGFVGINIVRYLAETHPERRILATDLHAPAPECWAFLAGFANIDFSRLDVTDRAQCRAAALQARGGDIVHAAALTPPSLSKDWQRPRIFDINLGGTLNMLESAADASVRRVVLLSSGGVYGAGQSCDPLSEEAPLDLSNTYAASKRAAEVAAEFYASSGAVMTAALRLSAVYGEMERLGPSSQAISLVMRLARLDRPVTLSGPEIARDWIHASDVGAAVDALLRAARLNHVIYNVGAGMATSAGQLASILSSHGMPISIVRDERVAEIRLRPEDARPALSIARLKAETGFAPRVNIAEGLAGLIAAARSRER